MDFCRLMSIVMPNLLVMVLAVGMLCVAEFYVFAVAKDYISFGWLVFWRISTLFFFAMWCWCWFNTILTDPGSVKEDLRRKGILERIQNGDIPYCLSHLPLCPKCNLPKHPKAHHCSVCNKCYLRMDHHCGVTGCCIADKNFKSFILNFFYAFFYGLSMGIPGIYLVIRMPSTDIVVCVFGLYGLILGILLAIFGGSFAYSSASGIGTIDKLRGEKPVFSQTKMEKFLLSLGNTWFERLTPYQKECTPLAWSGIEFDPAV